MVEVGSVTPFGWRAAMLVCTPGAPKAQRAGTSCRWSSRMRSDVSGTPENFAPW